MCVGLAKSIPSTVQEDQHSAPGYLIQCIFQYFFKSLCILGQLLKDLLKDMKYLDFMEEVYILSLRQSTFQVVNFSSYSIAVPRQKL